MRPLSLLLLVFISISVYAQSRTQTDLVKDRIISDLQLLEDDYLSRLSEHDLDRALTIVDDIYSLLDELRDPDQYEMSEDAFQSLKETIKNEPFRSNRINIIKTAAENGSFTVRQVSEVLQLMTFSDERIETIRTLYPWIVDKRNSIQLFDVLEFNNEKDELRKVIEEFNGHGKH